MVYVQVPPVPSVRMIDFPSGECLTVAEAGMA